MIAALYNLHTRQKETDPVHEWVDFFPEWTEPTEPQSDDEMFDNMKMWALATGGELPST